MPKASADGSFQRNEYTIRGRITADGSSGFRAEPGRYHLYISLACPWAHRSLVVRKLLRLEDVISVGVVDPVRDERGWAFSEGNGHGLDTVNGFLYLSEAYHRTQPDFVGRYTVPCLWDRQTGQLVSNNFPDPTIDFKTAFTGFHAPDAPNLYPDVLHSEIDALNAVIYEDINNGVYKAGFATSQAAHEKDG